MKRSYSLFATLFLIDDAFAVSPNWEIVPAQSKIQFIAQQNNAPVSGQFTTYSGKILFDPNHLNESKMDLEVDTSSISMSYSDIANALKGEDWLESSKFPKAKFSSNNITAVNNKQYQTNGTLTIRDKSEPMTINFTLETFTPDHASVKGEFAIKRSFFGLGRGEWADTNEIKDEVKIEFVFDLK